MFKSHNFTGGPLSAINQAIQLAATNGGAVYNLHNLGTLFQDSAGTTPVTSAGDPVGLVYDVSQGLAEGADIVTNGIFASDTSWDKGTGWSIGSGVATRTNTGGATNLEQLSFPVSDNVFYLVSYEITAYTSGSIRSAFTGGSASVGAFKTSTGVYTELIFSDAGNDVLAFQASSTFAGSIDNVSVKSLAGNHAIQTTSGSRPTYRVDARGFAYLEFDGTDDYLTIPGSDSALKFMHDGTGGNAVFSAHINDANPDSFQAVMGNSRFVTDIGFFIAHDDRSGSGFEDRLYYLVSDGSSNIIVERSSDDAFPAQTTSVIRYHLDNSLDPDITGYVDNSQVLSANASGAFSSSNSTADITIGARNSASGVADFCNFNWYGGLFTPTLTDQQAFELTRYYAQISGATL